VSAASLPNLLAPLTIGQVELRNRLVMTGHVTGMAKDHFPGDQLREYYLERARGGVAMIVSEAQSIHPTAIFGADNIFLFDERVVPYLRAISDDLHEHGCRYVAQLWHCGTNTDGMKTERPVWGASAMAGPLNHEIAHEMTTEEIAEIVAAYALGATHARAGGADGVEIHMAHGYLPHQYMSPFTNKRDDRYGGSLENRMRFPLEVLRAVREAAGPDLIVGVRLSAEEGVPGGLALSDNIETASILADTGLVSYFSISFGNYHNMELQTASMGTPAGHLTHLASQFRAALDVPILAVGRILSTDLAETVLASGQADLIGMARPLMADPRLLRKATGEDPARQRLCIGCNHCQTRLWMGTHVSCIYNPTAGREQELGHETIVPSELPRSVVVVGAGPAGLEAARVARLRGHEVSVFEREAEPGGQLRFAARLSSQPEIGGVLDFLTSELERLGVSITLGSEVSATTLAELNPDAVVVATGSSPRTDGFSGYRSDLQGIPGIGTANALTPWEVLSSDAPLEGTVLVVDFEGHVQAMALAEHLMDLGSSVEITTPHPYLGIGVGGTRWIRLTQKLSAKGVVIHPNTMVAHVDGSRVELANAYGGESIFRHDVDTIVLVGDSVANDSLSRELAATEHGWDVIPVGDCVAPRRLELAVLEGHRAGRSI
jgi:mycofactocin system FadH/OYE family oxidoreductase 2